MELNAEPFLIQDQAVLMYQHHYQLDKDSLKTDRAKIYWNTSLLGLFKNLN